jgi:two-component system cell cycle sensor histidine kinase/response regulator CckA
MASSDSGGRVPYLLLALFLLLVAATVGAGYLYFLRQKQTVRSEFASELSTIANLKVSQVVRWRHERLGDAKIIAASARLLPAIGQVLDRPGNLAARRQVTDWLETFCGDLGYANAILVDVDGNVRAEAGKAFSHSQHYAALARMVVRAGDIVFRDFHRDNGLSGIHLGLLVPMRTGESGTLSGVLLLGIDASKFLYPVIQIWPTPSASAETLLVRRDGDYVFFLNELRHRKNTALTLRIPVSHSTLPAAQAVLGREGVMDGIDYRGTPVLAVTRRVPDTPWFLVAKVDIEEMNRPLRRQSILLALIVASLIAAIAAGVAWLWRRQRLRFYQQRYEAELERRALLGHYDYLSRYANDSILLTDELGQIIEANDRATITYGYAREELLGLNLRRLRDPASLPDFDTEWREAARRDGYVFQTLHCRKDGSSFPAEISVRVIDVDGVRFHQSIVRDITERRRAEDALRTSEARLERAQRMAALGNWEAKLSPTGEPVPDKPYYWSDEVYRIFGVSREHFVPNRESFYASVHPDDRERVLNSVRASVASRRPYNTEHRIIRPDGTQRYVREHAEIELDEAGNIRLIGTVQDITDFKRLQDQFLQSQRLESIGRLAGGVAHDFNNLLTVIIGYCDLVEAKIEGESPMASPIGEIRNAAERAAGLTEQLLAFSRKQIVQPKVLHLNSVIRETERMLSRLIGEDVELVTHLAEDLGAVVADPSQINQVLMNLAVNARDAMPDGGKLILETRNVGFDAGYVERHPGLSPGPYVSLVVSDTGSGMNEEARSHLFEPFFTTKKTGKGTGLGLSTVYGIVKQAGGHVWVYSEPGVGTTFHICLPRVEAAAEAVPSKAPAADLSGTETVLVVEDQENVRHLTIDVLRGYGYQVLDAESGADALRICRNHAGSIHLLLTDVVMPGMTGRELAEKLKLLRPEIKALFMSGYTDNVIVHHGALDPEVAYLQKPFSPVTLAAKVRETLAASA